MRFPRADIHELLTPDLLHQVIKGTFKDHLIQWIVDYLGEVYSTSKAEEILDEIDRRYANFPPKLFKCINVLQHRPSAPFPRPPEVQAGTEIQTVDRKRFKSIDEGTNYISLQFFVR